MEEARGKESEGRMATAKKTRKTAAGKKRSSKKNQNSVAQEITGYGLIVLGVFCFAAVLMGGVVSYDPRVKHEVLGVSQEVIGTVGVVSEACALQMADGARKLLKVDVALSATGVAGPTGGTAENPVGTVWLGVSTAEGTIARRFQFDGDRQSVRRQTVETALRLALDVLASK